MSDQSTVSELFELAILAEKTAEQLYLRLVDKFVHCPDVAAFWQRYAEEEAGHARWLERLHSELPPAERAALADPGTLNDARKILQFSLDNTLARVHNLEDAYQMVTELENSETNAIFEFLITNYALAQRSRAFLLAQVKQHAVNIAAEFPIQYRGADLRLAVLASEE